MNKRTAQKWTMLRRVAHFLRGIRAEWSPGSPGREMIARFEEELGALEGIYGVLQAGSVAFHASVSRKSEIRKELLGVLRLLRDAALVLEEEGGIRQRYAFDEKVPESVLLHQARQILGAANREWTTLASLLEPEVLEQLTVSIEAFASEIARRNGGLGQQIRGNADLNEQLRKLSVRLEKLDRLMRIQFRDQPSRLAEWKATRRMRQRPRTESTPHNADPACVGRPESQVHYWPLPPFTHSSRHRIARPWQEHPAPAQGRDGVAHPIVAGTVPYLS